MAEKRTFATRTQNGLVAIVFDKPVRESSSMYNEGETAGFKPEAAAFLVEKGFAHYLPRQAEV